MGASSDLASLRAMGRPLVTTRDAAIRLGRTESTASHLLRRLADAGVIRPVRRGLWAIEPDVDPMQVVPWVTAPYPSYVSLWSALHAHRMLSQIPRETHVVSVAGRTESTHRWASLSSTKSRRRSSADTRRQLTGSRLPRRPRPSSIWHICRRRTGVGSGIFPRSTLVAGTAAGTLGRGSRRSRPRGFGRSPSTVSKRSRRAPPQPRQADHPAAQNRSWGAVHAAQEPDTDR